MRLFIAEKPDMGRKIASVLPGPHIRKDGYIETGGGLVSWCFGHLLGQAEPGAYDPKYAKFPGDFPDLPVVPQTWQIEVTEGKGKQVTVLKGLLRQCTEVVHAGDPGREGQLIVDEVLDYLKNKKPVYRLILNSLDKPTILKALNEMLPNQHYDTLYQAALGRQRSDWLVGMNMTRAYTILANKQGHRGVLSLGRVQTPTLGIVVRRDEEIENFVAKDYWKLAGLFATQKPEEAPFWCRWLPHGANAAEDDSDQDGKDPIEQEDQEEEESAEADPNATATGGAAAPIARPAWLDDKNRIVDKAQAEKMEREIKAAGKGTVTHAQHKPSIEPPPLPFELSSLQSELNRMTGASIDDVLKACQELYEKGHVSYPRTDCQYIPPTQHVDAPNILAAIGQASADLSAFLPKTDPTRSSRAFDAKKMEGEEHNGIIPTGSAPDLSQCTPLQQTLYKVVAKRYLAQFMPDCKVDKSSIEIDCASHRFVASGRIVRQLGWRELYASEAQASADNSTKETALPAVEVGSSLDLKDTKLSAHRTAPPPRFTQGTLVKAMMHVDRLVSDPVERKKLKSVKGIGRSATRAGILNTLLKREFIVPEKGKALISSPVARILIKSAPKALTDPGLTARWETVLDAVATGQISLQMFEQKQVQWLHTLLQHASSTTLPQLPPSTYQPKASGSSSSSSGSSGKSFGKSTGKSGSTGAKKSTGGAGGGKTCSVCKKGQMREREVKQGPKAGQKFLGCSNFPECKHSEWPK